jgi:soluble lytic murein transglycosylase
MLFLKDSPFTHRVSSVMSLIRKTAAAAIAAATFVVVVSPAPAQQTPETALDSSDGSASVLPDVLSAGGNESPDASFLALRDAARRDDGLKAFVLASRLVDYGIPSYVDYYRLKPRMHEMPETEIRQFLQQYQGSAIADRLRNDWLLELGKAGSWTAFDEQYPQFELDDDVQLKCYALMSKAHKGVNVAAEARTLLMSPRVYGDGCFALVAALAENGQWTKADVWIQVRHAAERGALSAARRIAATVEAPEKLVNHAIDKPALIIAKGAGKGSTMHELFLLAITQAGKKNPEQAASALSRASSHLTASQQAEGWARIALSASYKLMPEAVEYWKRSGNAALPPETHEWKVRMALRTGDWKLVKANIDSMPAELRQDPAWVYWRARALMTGDRKEEAQAQLRSIADQTHFYGQLATEELGLKIVAPARAAAPTTEELAAAAGNQGFSRALKFFEMGLRFEGIREWNWQLRKMNDRQLLAAAEFARQNNVLDRMVNTSDRTRLEVDFTQRFPTPYHDIMSANTQTLGLDMAWVYGLIRQESRFIMSARSHAGASGLMQIMPATARYVAKRIGVTDFTQSRINDIDMNILLGTNYLGMVLNDLEGSQAMASAAYNAGPGRPRAWRSTLTREVEGAIFAETIPFSETRGYVKNVLSNATYYAALFENRPQSLKARLGQVAPKGFVATDLP